MEDIFTEKKNGETWRRKWTRTMRRGSRLMRREKCGVSAYLCSPCSLLSAVVAVFKTAPLGLING